LHNSKQLLGLGFRSKKTFRLPGAKVEKNKGSDQMLTRKYLEATSDSEQNAALHFVYARVGNKPNMLTIFILILNII
jgi:hypothetical protein